MSAQGRPRGAHALTQIDAFALTLMIEACAALAIGRALGLQMSACALAALLGSMLTHPLLWMVFYDVHALVGPLTTPLLEMAVFLAEAPVYRLVAGCRWIDALLASLHVNAASWGAGEVIYAMA